MIRFSELDQSKYYYRVLASNKRTHYVGVAEDSTCYILYDYLAKETIEVSKRVYDYLCKSDTFEIIGKDTFNPERHSMEGILGIDAEDIHSFSMGREGATSLHIVDGKEYSKQFIDDELTMDMLEIYKNQAMRMIMTEGMHIDTSGHCTIENVTSTSIAIPEGVLSLTLHSCRIEEVSLPKSCKVLRIYRSYIRILEEKGLVSLRMSGGLIINLLPSDTIKILGNSSLYRTKINSIHGKLNLICNDSVIRNIETQNDLDLSDCVHCSHTVELMGVEASKIRVSDKISYVYLRHVEAREIEFNGLIRGIFDDGLKEGAIQKIIFSGDLTHDVEQELKKLKIHYEIKGERYAKF